MPGSDLFSLLSPALSYRMAGLSYTYYIHTYMYMYIHTYMYCNEYFVCRHRSAHSIQERTA